MTDIGRRRFVQGALGTTAFLALPGRLWPTRSPLSRPGLSPIATRRSSRASRSSSTAATGTPTSGSTSPASSIRTSISWRRRAATPSRSASSPGRRSSPRRGPFRARLARRRDGRPREAGLPRLPRDAERGQAAVDVREVRGGAADRRAGPARAARLAPQPLLHVARLPGKGPNHQHEAGRALQGPPGPCWRSATGPTPRCTSSGARAGAPSRRCTARWWITRARTRRACSRMWPPTARCCASSTRWWGRPCGPRSRS